LTCNKRRNDAYAGDKTGVCVFFVHKDNGRSAPQDSG